MAEPIVLEPPPNDPELGTNNENVGESCVDIMMNGGPKVSGTYWIKTSKFEEPFNVYCD